jgi:ribosomal protein S27E
MAKLSERQININTQFGEDMVEVKTQQLFQGQALGVLARTLEGLLARLQERRLLPEDDPLVRDFRRAMEELRRVGLRAEPPQDPQARTLQVHCPGCQAVVKARPGQARIDRCDWCGHVFDAS